MNSSVVHSSKYCSLHDFILTIDKTLCQNSKFAHPVLEYTHSLLECTLWEIGILSPLSQLCCLLSVSLLLRHNLTDPEASEPPVHWIYVFLDNHTISRSQKRIDDSNMATILPEEQMLLPHTLNV